MALPTNKRPKIMLLDGHSLAFRAFYALPEDLQTTDGTHTNAAYGFTSMLIKLLQEQRPDYIAVCFDAGAPLERTAAYADYKATRTEAPATFGPQVPLIREVLRVLRIPVFELPGHEADDIISYLACKAAANDLDVRIVTGDRDFFQLIDDRIHVLYNRRGITDIVEMDAAAVAKRYGVPPDKYVDLKALEGDTSDNLPGVPGVGTKTAARLVQAYGSAEAALEHASEQTPKLAVNLGAHAEQVVVNKQLSRLVEVPLEGVEIDDLKMSAWNLEEVRELFGSLEFRTLLERLLADLPDAAAGEGRPFEIEVQIASTRAELEELARALSGAGEAAIEVEPTSARRAPRSVAFTYGDGNAVYAPVEGAEFAQIIGPVLADQRFATTAHGARAAYLSLMSAGIEPRGLRLDTQVAAYLLDPAAASYPLEDVARKYAGREVVAVEPAQRPEPGDQGAFDLTGGQAVAAEEAGLRALAVAEVGRAVVVELERLSMLELYRDIEHPLISILADMERVGVKIDLDYLNDIARDLDKRVAELESECYDLAGERLNLGSPPQLRELLYGRLGLKTTRRTKTGLSTDARALQQLVDQHPFVQKLLDYRELAKLKNTYVDALPPLVDRDDGRIHTTYEQTATTTGRISSTNPNLQNIPVRTEIGRKIRRAFVPDPGYVLLSADYSQIELRVMAHLSEDPVLLDILRRQEDVHAATAVRIFKIDPKDLTVGQRSAAKMVNYGLAYGMQAPGLAERLNSPLPEAQQIMDAYFEQFGGVKEFLDQTVTKAYADGFTTTMFGRRRYLPELGSGNPRVRAIGERQALNAPIQGSAADIMKLAMIRVHEQLAAGGFSTRMIMTVHDELVFEVPESERVRAAGVVVAAMTGVCEMQVPLVVDHAFGTSWADAKG